MTTAQAPVIQGPDEIASDWLGSALGRNDLEISSVESIGTGQMSQSLRVTFTENGADAETVVVKLASDDPTSRATGVGLGAYHREVAFYQNLAARIGGPLPECHFAEYDHAEGWFTIVLEDIADATQGDQIAGCSVEDARIALRALAQIHAPVLNDLSLGASDWLNLPNPLNQALLTQLLPVFLERYEGRVAPEHAEVCEKFVPCADAWWADQRPPLGLVHGDHRPDNLLFGDGTCKVVDWQTVAWGSSTIDLSYFIGGALVVEDRRAHEQDLVGLYHDTLLEQGIEGYSRERCWEDYRRMTFQALVMAIAASMVVQRTERGDEMFMTNLARAAQQIIDLDALALLPEPTAGKPAPLQPPASDEGHHPPGPEPTWNESWYFDAVSDSGDLGLYTRIGRVPNQGLCLYTACICGPDRPSIMLVDGNAPLPAPDDETQIIDISGLHAEHICEVPLERYRIKLAGTAQSHADASAPLRGEQGEPIEIEFDLVWETDGTPYAWRQATRYEIPCRVSGSVRIGDERIEFAGPGQRDHSWGARDWWGSDWMWSGLHLEDGTHTHAVGVPQLPGFGVGYVQHEGVVAEIESVNATEVVADNGLITAATIESGPLELKLEIEPVGYGAILLVAPDGRVSHFPRAMCKVRAKDGRTGSGWVEWNRNQREAD